MDISTRLETDCSVDHPERSSFLILCAMASGLRSTNFEISTEVTRASLSAALECSNHALECAFKVGNKEGDGRIQELSESRVREIIAGYMEDGRYPCVMRKHQGSIHKC